MHAKISWLIGWWWLDFKIFNTREKITVDRLTMIKLQILYSTQKNPGWSVDDSMKLWKYKYAFKTWLMGWQWFRFKLFNARKNILVDRLAMIKLQNFQCARKNYGWSVDSDKASKTLMHAKKSRLMGWRLDEIVNI